MNDNGEEKPAIECGNHCWANMRINNTVYRVHEPALRTQTNLDAVPYRTTLFVYGRGATDFYICRHCGMLYYEDRPR